MVKKASAISQKTPLTGKPRKKSSKKRTTTISIGVLSGIPFTGTPYKPAFEGGLGSLPAYPKPQERLGYSSSSFQAGLTILNSEQPTLIIAIGGIVAELPATNNPQINTISLVGGKVQGSHNPGGHFKDRINLGSADTDPHRINYLRQMFGIQKQDICLLYNSNSAMGATQANNFNTSVSTAIDQTTTDQQATTAYSTAFSQVPGTIKAVIVSADPWFKQTSNLLVPIANGWVMNGMAGKRVCYPFQEYNNDGPQVGHTTLYGPRLTDAYNCLGQLAAYVINPSLPPPGQPIQVISNI